MSVRAVIVTRDRVDLLRECLAAIGRQTSPVDGILVVDNASSDGTADVVRAEFPAAEIVSLPENVGGAGGFHEGLRLARKRGDGWAWIMDDDTIPEPGALEQLLAAAGPDTAGARPAILASKVVWTDGQLHPMNIPGPDPRRALEMLAEAERGVVPIRSASFVSLLLDLGAVDRHGLPDRDYFIWFDDVEYTARILREETGYYVPRSVAVHKTARRYSTATSSGDRFYYAVRNRLYMLRGDSWTGVEKYRLARSLVRDVRAYLAHNDFSPAAARVVLRGLAHGLARRV